MKILHCLTPPANNNKSNMIKIRIFKNLKLLLFNIMNNNSYYELDKLINIIKSFNGKIFGKFVREYYIDLMINNFHNVDLDELDINIIFDSESITKKFIRIVNQHFELNKNLNVDDKNINIYYLVFNYEDDTEFISKIVNLNIIEYTNNIAYNYYINKFSNNIDINYLSLNNNSLFLLDLFSYFNYNNNNLLKLCFNTILNRNSNKKFSFIFKPVNLSKYIIDLDVAYNIVKKGFLMDDTYKNDISVLFKWKNVNKNIRTYYSDDEKSKLKNNNECSICSSKFSCEDIVINTKCNHNFHWNCCNNNSGLKNWITNFKVSCPICRKTDFNFI